MTEQKGDTFKFIMGRTAVERLIGNDASTEVILTDQAVRSFIGKHLTRLETIIRSQAESITKEMLETTVTQLLGKVETLRDGKRYIPSADMAETITRMLEPLVDKRLREIVTENMQDIDAKIANVAEAYVVGEIDKRVKTMLDNATQLMRAAAASGTHTPEDYLSMRARMAKQVAEAKAKKEAQAQLHDALKQSSHAVHETEMRVAAKLTAPPQDSAADSRRQPGPIPPAVATRSWDQIAALAYSAYVAAQLGEAEPSKPFADLPASQQRGWQAAVRHAANCTSWRSDTDPSKWVGWRPPV